MDKISYFVSLQHFLDILEIWEGLSLPVQWAGLGFTFLLLERHFTRGIALLISFAAFATSIMALPMPPTWFFPQAIAFAIFMGVGFYFRPILMERYIDTEDKFPAPHNRVLGRPALCVGEINGLGGSGRVKLGGHQWTAIESEGRLVKERDEVLIVGRLGMTLLVEKGNHHNSVVSSRLVELVGKNGIWDQNGHVQIDKTLWPAQEWPRGIRIQPGRTVAVVGVKAQTLLVKPEADVVKELENLEGLIGVCKHQIEGLSQPGSVLINDVIWRARADHESTKITEGQLIEVVEMDGATMVVDGLARKMH